MVINGILQHDWLENCSVIQQDKGSNMLVCNVLYSYLVTVLPHGNAISLIWFLSPLAKHETVTVSCKANVDRNQIRAWLDSDPKPN